MRKREPTNILPAHLVPGVNVRSLRESLEWSLDDLAQRIGASGSTISRIERGLEVNMAKVALIAQALGVPFEMLFLPPELMVYARLAPERQKLIADMAAQLYAAQHAGSAPPLAKPPGKPALLPRKNGTD